MASFEELYRAHMKLVFRYTFQCVGRRDVAEDITSEVFLLLFRNLEGLDHNQLPGWLFTVAKNRARDYWRHQQVEQRYAENAAMVPAANPQPPLERMLIESAVLKPIHRVCLSLRYLYGMTLEEIARQTGLSELQVKGHLQYARQLLRNQHVKVTK